MPCALSETGPKVSIATITPTVVSRPQPASATANSETVSERAAEQERAEHGGADDQRGVDGRLEADREAGQDDGGRAGQRGLADVLDRAVLGAGEVAGQRQDDRGQHDAVVVMAKDHVGAIDQRHVAAELVKDAGEFIGDIAAAGDHDALRQLVEVEHLVRADRMLDARRSRA